MNNPININRPATSLIMELYVTTRYEVGAPQISTNSLDHIVGMIGGTVNPVSWQSEQDAETLPVLSKVRASDWCIAIRPCWQRQLWVSRTDEPSIPVAPPFTLAPPPAAAKSLVPWPWLSAGGKHVDMMSPLDGPTEPHEQSIVVADLSQSVCKSMRDDEGHEGAISTEPRSAGCGACGRGAIAELRRASAQEAPDGWAVFSSQTPNDVTLFCA